MPKKRGVSEPADEPGKAARKDLVRRLRAALVEQPLTIAQMVEALGADESAVLAALRRLRKSGKTRVRKAQHDISGAASDPNRLRSGMVAGRPCWWWKPEAGAAVQPPAQ